MTGPSPLEDPMFQEKIHFLIENGDVEVDYDFDGEPVLKITMPDGGMIVDESGWRRIKMASFH